MPTLQLVRTNSNRPVITLRINNHDYRFLIDTGATHTFLDPVLIPQLSKEQDATRRKTKTYGVAEVAYFERIDIRFNFAGVQVTSLMFHKSVASDSDQTHGIIGQDILQQFKSVTFDNMRRTVKFEL